MILAIKSFPRLFKFNSHGSIQWWEIKAEEHNGVASIVVKYAQEGGAIQETSTRTHGKNIGKRNETTAYQQACSEAESKWLKQKDKGYTEGHASKRAPNAPMLAQSYADHRSKVIFPCFFQPKLDGIRAVAEKLDGKVTLWSRQGKELPNLPHINSVLESIMEDGQILDGELYHHGTPFQTLISWVKKAQPESKKIIYNVYDMVSDKKFSERFKDFCDIIGRNGAGVVKTVFTSSLNSHEEIEAAHVEQVERGFEGIMLRVSDCYYKSGGRSSELLKVKLFKDDEFEIIGAHEGKGKSEGQATFICRTKAGDEFNCRPRGEDALREYYWKHKDSFVGKMLTVRYFEWTTGPNPVPRFPVGIAVRDYE